MNPAPQPLPLAGWRYHRAHPTAPEPLAELPRNRVLIGDAREQLSRLPADSVDCCVTSPPYYQLRDYGVAGQLGLEAHVDDWVAGLRAVLAEVGRVLKPTGALWLNLGDAYSTARRYGAPPKGLLLAPERLLLALAQDGWLVRNKVIWAKPNPMPHSVRDRLNTSYELVYLLVRSRTYVFHLDEIRAPHRSAPPRKASRRRVGKYDSPTRSWAGTLAPSRDNLPQVRANGRLGHVLGKNPGDVWWLPTGGFKGAHFATFPEALIERPVRATCPERLCTACGSPWQRAVTRRASRDGQATSLGQRHGDYQLGSLQPTCPCASSWRPGVVLDPFFGAGTVGVVAERLRRDWLGVELNPAYAQLAESRIHAARQRQPTAATERAA